MQYAFLIQRDWKGSFQTKCCSCLNALNDGNLAVRWLFSSIPFCRWESCSSETEVLINRKRNSWDLTPGLKVLHSICQQIWKTQQWPQNWKRLVFIPIAKKGNTKESSKYCTIALISHASKVMLQILQASLQQYLNGELSVVQAGFRKGRGTRDQIADIHWIIEKAIEFQKNIYFCFIDHAKAFECVNHNKLWKILQEMGIPDHLTCNLRNLYAGQEATVRDMKQQSCSK